MEKSLELDDIDRKILSLLMEDADLPYTEIAKRVFVSGGTIHVRMKKMKEMGIVEGSRLKVNYSRIGYDVMAFLGIYLEKSSLYDEAAEGLSEIPEVINVNYTTGSYSIFAKLICKDTQHLRRVLHDKVQKVRGVQRTETFISLDETINRTIDLFGKD
ncbi:MAG TPA: winged helix-turn-helix transcriptional regulator [Balneolaceae bacterium]